MYFRGSQLCALGVMSCVVFFSGCTNKKELLTCRPGACETYCLTLVEDNLVAGGLGMISRIARIRMVDASVTEGALLAEFLPLPQIRSIGVIDDSIYTCAVESGSEGGFYAKIDAITGAVVKEPRPSSDGGDFCSLTSDRDQLLRYTSDGQLTRFATFDDLLRGSGTDLISFTDVPVEDESLLRRTVTAADGVVWLMDKGDVQAYRVWRASLPTAGPGMITTFFPEEWVVDPPRELDGASAFGGVLYMLDQFDDIRHYDGVNGELVGITDLGTSNPRYRGLACGQGRPFSPPEKIDAGL